MLRLGTKFVISEAEAKELKERNCKKKARSNSGGFGPPRPVRALFNLLMAEDKERVSFSRILLV